MKRSFWLVFSVGLSLAVAVGTTSCVRPRPGPTPELPKVSYAPTATQAADLAPQATRTLPAFTPTSTHTPMPADVEVVESPTATPTAVATPPVAPDEGVEVRYEVRWGDTLTAIARRYGTTVEAIRARNPEITDPHRVHAGSVLIIPSSARVDPGSVTTPPATQEHIIQRGDTLSAIASRYGTTVQALMQANPWITNPSYIEAGRCLVIQSGTGATAPVVHVVRAGETLTAIARLYNTTIWAIVVRNNLVNPSFIYAGQRLIIP